MIQPISHSLWFQQVYHNQFGFSSAQGILGSKQTKKKDDGIFDLVFLRFECVYARTFSGSKGRRHAVKNKLLRKSHELDYV